MALLVEALNNPGYSGVYNGTAPNPVRMSELCSSLGASQLSVVICSCTGVNANLCCWQAAYSAPRHEEPTITSSSIASAADLPLPLMPPP